MSAIAISTCALSFSRSDIQLVCAVCPLSSLLFACVCVIPSRNEIANNKEAVSEVGSVVTAEASEMECDCSE